MWLLKSRFDFKIQNNKKVLRWYLQVHFPFAWLSEFLVHVHQDFQVDLDSFPNIGYVYSNNASLIFFI